MRPFIESFLPLFVAINPMGIIPIYLSVTENLTAPQRRRLTLQAMLTAGGSRSSSCSPGSSSFLSSASRSTTCGWVAA